MSDTYVDTPGREDAQWLEDIRERALISGTWYGELNLRRVTIRHAAEQQDPSGRFRVFAPEDYGKSGFQSLDWGMAWVYMLHDDFVWHGEAAFVERYFANLVRFMEVAYLQSNADGMLADRTCLSDLFTSLKADFDAGELQSISNSAYYGCLTLASKLAVAIGANQWASTWSDRATKLRSGFQRFLAANEEGKELPAEVWSPFGPCRGFGQGAVVMAVFHRILLEEKSRRFLKTVFCGADGAPPPAANAGTLRPTPIAPCAPFPMPASERWQGDISSRDTGPILPDGPLPEYFLPLIGQPNDPTGSHGWAASPLVWFHDTVLGVRLREKRRVFNSMDPALGGLESVHRRCSHPSRNLKGLG